MDVKVNSETLAIFENFEPLGVNAVMRLLAFPDANGIMG